MFIHKPKFIALTLLFLGGVATAAGYLANALAMNDEPKSSTAGQQSAVDAKPDDANPSPAPGRMVVVGRVLDPKGNPVPGATIAVYARSVPLGPTQYLFGRRQIPIGDARANVSGRFRIDAPRTASSHHEAVGATALAPGYGVGWVELDPDDDRPSANIALRPEQVIDGRLFDLQGRPVPDVTISVSSIRRDLPQAPARVFRRFDGIAYWGTNANDLPAWPEPVMTDPEGHFTLRGVGRDLRAVLTVHHPRFALQRIEVETNSASESKPLTAALAPAQIVKGRVTYGDTGEPVPHAPLELMASQGRIGIPAEFETDIEGQFRVNPPLSDRSYRVTAFPPEGQPYLIAAKRLDWPKGAIEQSLDLALTRGVLIHGKVTEEGSGKPVPGATVGFFCRGDRGGKGDSGSSIVVNGSSDGSFQLGAEPRPGCLFVTGPSDDYVLQEIGLRLIDEGHPGGIRMYSHAYTLLDLKTDSDSQQVNVVLRRGTTVRGQVVGPDGQPIQDAWLLSRIILDLRHGVWRSWTGRRHGNVRDGRFEVHGLGPDTEVPVYFLEPKRKLGVVANLSARSAASGPVTIRLEPCGAAKARVVDNGGKPVAARLAHRIITMLVTPGQPSSLAKDKAGLLSADETGLNEVDTVNYASELVSDADGRITLPVLIPGATYRFIDDSTAVRGETGPALRKEFTVKPGETIDLGDIRVEKPPG
jgi:protocatechuate 3,4-dioxygenase beta subunit